MLLSLTLIRGLTTSGLTSRSLSFRGRTTFWGLPLWVYNLGCDDQVSYIQGYYNKGSYVKGSYDQGKECITINWDI